MVGVMEEDNKEMETLKLDYWKMEKTQLSALILSCTTSLRCSLTTGRKSMGKLDNCNSIKLIISSKPTHVGFGLQSCALL